MKKQIKIIIIVAALLFLLVGAMIVLLCLPSDKEDPSSAASSETLTLINHTVAEIEQISVSNESGEYTILTYYATAHKSKDSSQNEASSDDESSTDTSPTSSFTFTMQDNKYELSQNEVGKLASECASLITTKTINSAGKSDSDYGLSKPRSTVEVRFNDGTKETVYIGNEAPGDEGVYIKTSQSGTIYLVNSDDVAYMLKSRLELLSTSITEALDDGDTLKSFSVGGEGIKNPISISYGDVSQDGIYVMSEPEHSACSASYISDFAEQNLYPFDAESVAAIDVKKDKLKEYGLDKPYYTVSFSNGRKGTELLFSKPDDKNSCYMMEKDTEIIYKISAASVEFAKTDYNSFLSETIISPSAVKLSSAEIYANGVTNDYAVKNDVVENIDGEKNIVTTVTLGDSEINSRYFQNMLSNLMIFKRTKDLPNKVDGEVLFSVKLNYEESDISDTLAIYTYDKRALVVFNGKPVGVTELQTAEKFVADAELVAQNKDVEPFAEAEEE